MMDSLQEAKLNWALAALDDLWPTLTTPGQLRAIEKARNYVKDVLHGEDR